MGNICTNLNFVVSDSQEDFDSVDKKWSSTMRKPVPWDGKLPIRQPGLYSGIPLAVYHSQDILPGPSVSSSGLRRVLEINGGSPAHFYCEWSGNPDCKDEKVTEAFTLGRAAHHLFLGQKDFDKLFVLRPDVFPDYRTAAARAWRDDTQARGFTILTERDIETIRGMALSLASNALVKPPRGHGLLNGMIECSGFWRDKETGLWIKSRPDAIPTDSGDYSDLKTMPSVQYVDVTRSITEFGYHQQAALIGEASELVADVPMSSFSLVCVEKTAPYCVQIVQLSDKALSIGRDLNHVAMRLVAKCLSEKRWPGPGDGHIFTTELTNRYAEFAEAEIGRAA